MKQSTSVIGIRKVREDTWSVPECLVEENSIDGDPCWATTLEGKTYCVKALLEVCTLKESIDEVNITLREMLDTDIPLIGEAIVAIARGNVIFLMDHSEEAGRVLLRVVRNPALITTILGVIKTHRLEAPRTTSSQ